VKLKKKKQFPSFIILADDDADDRLIFDEALQTVDKDIELLQFSGGEELLRFLKDEKNPLPELIFLDLNMPMINGFECLKRIRSDERLSKLCVIIYSTSNQFKDIMETLNNGANLYFSKPNELKELSARLQQIFSLNWDEFIPTVPIEKYVMSDGIY
jgi:PleD family two-component response regulator